MCGIWGVFGFKCNVNFLCMSCHRIAHRGPDAFRIESIPEIPRSCLGFHRLEIVDAIGGMQPMRLLQYPHVRLVYNGEIYNCRELKQQYGFEYQSKCDGEAIIHLYVRFGPEKAAELLDGVFSFMIIDTEKKMLYLGRDVFGVRPMFTFYDNGCLAVCSETKGLIELPKCDGVMIQPFPCGYVHSYTIDEQGQVFLSKTRMCAPVGGSDPSQFVPTHSDVDVHANIRFLLKKAVQKRLLADRRIGCLLSGGLDSSLIAALLVQCLKEQGCQYRVQTFAIGFNDSPDLAAARKMAEHLETEHHEITFTPKEGIENIKNIIHSLESFDITTIRASVGMYMLAKYIKENTDTTVIFSGEGADELFQGYIYFHKAPSPKEAREESVRLLKDLYLYDVLRADRTTAAHGLELRVPMLDKYFTSYILSLPAEVCQPQNSIEKYLLRQAFNGTGLLPDKILWRPKEAFSDGISSSKKSWYCLLQEHIEKLVSEKTLTESMQSPRFNGSVVPQTKEAFYYRELFDEMFPGCGHLIPYYWMPKWVQSKDPSARTLQHYSSS